MWGGEASRADKTTTSKPFYSSVPGIPLPLTGNPQVHFPTYPPHPYPLMKTCLKEASLVEKVIGLLQVCRSMDVCMQRYRTVPLAQNWAVPSKQYLLYFCLSLLFGVFTTERKGGKLWRPWPAAGTQYFRTALPTPDINFTPQLALTHSTLPYV